MVKEFGIDMYILLYLKRITKRDGQMDTCTGDQPVTPSVSFSAPPFSVPPSNLQASGPLGWASHQPLCVEREGLLMGGGSAVVITHSGLHACQ